MVCAVPDDDLLHRNGPIPAMTGSRQIEFSLTTVSLSLFVVTILALFFKSGTKQ